MFIGLVYSSKERAKHWSNIPPRAALRARAFPSMIEAQELYRSLGFMALTDISSIRSLAFSYMALELANAR